MGRGFTVAKENAQHPQVGFPDARKPGSPQPTRVLEPLPRRTRRAFPGHRGERGRQRQPRQPREFRQQKPGEENRARQGLGSPEGRSTLPVTRSLWGLWGLWGGGTPSPVPYAEPGSSPCRDSRASAQVTGAPSREDRTAVGGRAIAPEPAAPANRVLHTGQSPAPGRPHSARQTAREARGARPPASGEPQESPRTTAPARSFADAAAHRGPRTPHRDARATPEREPARARLQTRPRPRRRRAQPPAARAGGPPQRAFSGQATAASTARGRPAGARPAGPEAPSPRAPGLAPRVAPALQAPPPPSSRRPQGSPFSLAPTFGDTGPDVPGPAATAADTRREPDFRAEEAGRVRTCAEGTRRPRVPRGPPSLSRETTFPTGLCAQSFRSPGG
ncbi:translation initiation factor IF-2-like [Mustela erminea]|uniref:translation initiation factor IF-2-like n=1 Tax=Mustela erminea TaxID=36723 RepID=UPI001386F5D2|nr:translation initiation factor IF-2-like [Mustela erminea]